jgi:hypothetical protein
MTAASISPASRALPALPLLAFAPARLDFTALPSHGSLVPPSLAMTTHHASGAVDTGAGDPHAALTAAADLGHHGLTAVTFLLTSAGVLFFFGLVFGAWKYACIARSPEAQAPVYVDIAHRAALLYSFACVLVAELARASAWSNTVNLAAAIVLVTYFAAAVLGYAVHGVLRDTDNQLKRPHRLGKKTIGDGAMRAFLVSLIAAEIGSFLVIFTGYLAA